MNSSFIFGITVGVVVIVGRLGGSGRKESRRDIGAKVPFMIYDVWEMPLVSDFRGDAKSKL